MRLRDPRAASSAMYWAYQSGQFGSACPVSSSCLPCAAAARRSAAARPATESNTASGDVSRPGSRVLISCTYQLFPSGSLNDTHEP